MKQSKKKATSNWASPLGRRPAQLLGQPPPPLPLPLPTLSPPPPTAPPAHLLCHLHHLRPVHLSHLHHRPPATAPATSITSAIATTVGSTTVLATRPATNTRHRERGGERMRREWTSATTMTRWHDEAEAAAGGDFGSLTTWIPKLAHQDT
jgi:hypothetical protein